MKRDYHEKPYIWAMNIGKSSIPLPSVHEPCDLEPFQARRTTKCIIFSSIVHLNRRWMLKLFTSKEWQISNSSPAYRCGTWKNLELCENLEFTPVKEAGSSCYFYLDEREPLAHEKSRVLSLKFGGDVKHELYFLVVKGLLKFSKSQDQYLRKNLGIVLSHTIFV